jgi:hypothetical protein
MSISAGAGVANFKQASLSTAVMARGRLAVQDLIAFLGGVGVSRSRYTFTRGWFLAELDAPHDTWQGKLWWMNVEAGFESVPRGGRQLLLRFFVGRASMLNPEDLVCISLCEGEPLRLGRHYLPYVGLALMWRLL